MWLLIFSQYQKGKGFSRTGIIHDTARVLSNISLSDKLVNFSFLNGSAGVGIRGKMVLSCSHSSLVIKEAFERN